MTRETSVESAYIHRIVLRKALLDANPALVPLHFDAAVLNHYREASGFAIHRTDSVGRLKKQGDWSLDFGIAPDEQSIHASLGDLMRLPDADKEHWASFACDMPSSRMFLQMRLAPSACYDDGEVRSW